MHAFGKYQIYGTIEASGDPSDYENDLRHWLLIGSVQNLVIEGGGIINGNGKIWWQNSCKTNKALVSFTNWAINPRKNQIIYIIILIQSENFPSILINLFLCTCSKNLVDMYVAKFYSLENDIFYRFHLPDKHTWCINELYILRIYNSLMHLVWKTSKYILFLWQRSFDNPPYKGF